MSKSTHKVTRQQFSVGTTIDGNRLDKAAGDVVARYNAIEPSDMRRRFTQSQIVIGWEPSQQTVCSLPFMPSYNDNSAYWYGGTTPVDGVQNTWRAKGFISDRFLFPVDPVTGSPEKDMLLAVSSFYVRNPCILQGVSLGQFIEAYRVQYHTFNYETREGETWTSTPADDLSLTVMVDNPYAPEDMRQSSIVYHRIKFGADAHAFTQIVPGLGYPEMSPEYEEGFPEAVWIDDQRLNIPIPRDSRIRLIIGIPLGDPSNNVLPGPDDFHNPWIYGYTTPWTAQSWSSTVTLLEPLEE